MSERVAAINDLRRMIHDISPFKEEPVDFVRWEHVDMVSANDYNPNAVAPPEMALLEMNTRVSELEDRKHDRP